MACRVVASRLLDVTWGWDGLGPPMMMSGYAWCAKGRPVPQNLSAETPHPEAETTHEDPM